MTAQPESIDTRLRAALVAAFPGYLRDRLTDIGLAEEDALVDVVTAATNRLEASLQQDLRTEPPLELVRRATEPVTAALRERGVAAVSRDVRSVEIHPDDPFDLYPATSRDLGEDVWRVHMQWGLERARLVAGMVPAPAAEAKEDDSAAQRQAGPATPGVPAVALFGIDEPLRAELADRIRSLGYRPLLWRNPASLEAGLSLQPVLILAAAGHPRLDETLRDVAGRSRVLVVGDGLTDVAEARFMALGAEGAVSSDRVVDGLDGGLLPRLA